ncbi:MAG: hypothetical protein JW944_13845 [Deltaproteobacteria bacterium]|nr:hypothetical protein [Deltaproteobacteria bacterium]
MYRLGRRGFLELVILAGAAGFRCVNPFMAVSSASMKKDVTMILPKPFYKGSLSVEEAIKQRRTVRFLN